MTETTLYVRTIRNIVHVFTGEQSEGFYHAKCGCKIRETSAKVGKREEFPRSPLCNWCK